MKPFPTKSDCLIRLKNLGLNFRTVIDIGVRECTHDLIRALPECKHLLYEPVSFYFDRIKENYAQIDHELFGIALSYESGECYQVCTSSDGSGNPTHSRISHQPVQVDGKRVVFCEAVPVRRLDSVLSMSDIEQPILVKLDVDGHELAIMQGAKMTLKMASCIIVEATRENFFERSNFLLNHGFELFEIVDICYYDNVMWQMDAVFIRTDIKHNNRMLQPVPWGNFRKEAWYEVKP